MARRIRGAAGILSAACLVVGCRSAPTFPVGPAAKMHVPQIHSEASHRPVTPTSQEVPSPAVAEHRLRASAPLVDESSEAAPPSPREDFAPKGISPLAPTNFLAQGPMPKPYETRLDELARIGKQLASASDQEDRPLRFDVVYNPKRAATCHTEAGDILVTSALLERVKSRHQLAVALALEIAEHMHECDERRDRAGLASAGVPDQAHVGDADAPDRTRRPEGIESRATSLLAAAGFESLDLAAIRSDLEGLAAFSPPASAPGRAEPAWQGPKPIAAN